MVLSPLASNMLQQNHSSESEGEAALPSSETKVKVPTLLFLKYTGLSQFLESWTKNTLDRVIFSIHKVCLVYFHFSHSARFSHCALSLATASRIMCSTYGGMQGKIVDHTDLIPKGRVRRPGVQLASHLFQDLGLVGRKQSGHFRGHSV